MKWISHAIAHADAKVQRSRCKGADAGVQVLRRHRAGVEMQRGAEQQVQKECRRGGAEVQMQMCRCTEVQRCRGRGAEVQMQR